MKRGLYWSTVSEELRNALELLMHHDEFNVFRLVGGTALSLQLGHRLSVDIDLFTDALYETIDFDDINAALNKLFPFVSEFGKSVNGIGKFYAVGNTPDNLIKLDLLYTEPFIQNELKVDNVRMATLDEIVAMKIEIIQNKGRKKDFWDLHELLDRYTLEQMIHLHQLRYPFGHDQNLIQNNLSDFTRADEDFDPICLKGKHWELIKLDIARAAII